MIVPQEIVGSCREAVLGFQPDCIGHKGPFWKTTCPLESWMSKPLAHFLPDHMMKTQPLHDMGEGGPRCCSSLTVTENKSRE
jgi:hypothetical protein